MCNRWGSSRLCLHSLPLHCKLQRQPPKIGCSHSSLASRAIVWAKQWRNLQRFQDQKWCCSQTFDFCELLQDIEKPSTKSTYEKAFELSQNLESLLNWDPSRKGLRIRRGYVVLNCRMFWQACTYIHIYSSILHKHHVKSFYIVLRSTYVIFRYTAWSKYQSLTHLTTFPWHYLQKIHLMHLHIQRTCCWRKPATNQALAAFLLPRSDGRISHLCSQSSGYIWLHLLYFNDISMCFKDFCQIGSLERRHIDIACAKSLKSPSKACRKQEILSSPSFRFLHLAELSSLSFWLSEILKKGAASSLLCLLWLGLIQVGFGHLFTFAFDSFWFCLYSPEWITVYDYLWLSWSATDSQHLRPFCKLQSLQLVV